jgi:hypothetical protein
LIRLQVLKGLIADGALSEDMRWLDRSTLTEPHILEEVV